MKKLTDYVMDFLASQGITHVFGFTGGGAVHLFDSADRHARITPIYCHHEQAVALAAVSYARITDHPGCAVVTTGPGGTNTLTGVLAAWQDSIPCIFISGQARVEHTSHGKPLRQVGTQEFDIISVVKPMTKYAVMVEDARMIRYHLEKALYLAQEGRPGPVWIDLPLNFQWAMIEPRALKGFRPPAARRKGFGAADRAKVFAMLCSCRRPLLLAGYGIRLAHAEQTFRDVIKKLRMPFVSTWNASDYLPTDDKFYIGRIGIAGQRGANLAIQNCDLLVSVGSRLSIPLTGTLFNAFAREAKIICVDIDRTELKHKNVRVDRAIACDARSFLKGLLAYPDKADDRAIGPWLSMCRHYKGYNTVTRPPNRRKAYVDPYVFVDTLSDALTSRDTVIVDGGGTNLYISFQAFKVKSGQRLATSSGIAAMGTGLPESIGASFARGKGRVICLTGDGSIQLNIHELQTIVHHRLPVKIFVMNNNGYLAIRHTQKAFLKGNFTGSSPGKGLSLPDFQKVGRAYGLKTLRISEDRNLRQGIRQALSIAGPVLCEIMVSPDQELIATQGFDRNKDGTFSPRPLEDMYPFLGRTEFKKDMIVKPYVRDA